MKAMSVGLMLGVGDDPSESIRKAKEVGVDNVQLGCPPDRYLSGAGLEQFKKSIAESGLKVTTVFCGFAGESYADIPTIQRTVGFIGRQHREERVKKTFQISDFAKALGVDKIAAHIGFVPEEPSDPAYKEVVQTIQRIADYAKRNGQMFTLETGQEIAEVLLRFLMDVNRDNVGVNFDPANMILYGSGEPIAALETLKKYVVSIHCKDGKWPKAKGVLGEEVPLGEGDVGMEKFINKLKEIGYKGPLTIEREISGEKQKQDIIKAKALLERLRDK